VLFACWKSALSPAVAAPANTKQQADHLCVTAAIRLIYCVVNLPVRHSPAKAAPSCMRARQENTVVTVNYTVDVRTTVCTG